MLLLCYRLLFIPVLLGMAPYYLLRMRRRGGYRRHFEQRLGSHRWLPPKTGACKRIWLQAVSVGEILAITPMIEALHRDGVEIYLTTTTSTGYRLANDSYRGLTVGIAYFPIDWWPFSARTWRRINPDLAVLTEGERWPEHIHQAHLRGVPVICINARLSERGARRWKLFPAAARRLFRDITRILPCSTQDEARFLSAGFPAERMTMTGNIKLDVSIPILDGRAREALRGEIGLPQGGLILFGSSTWPGEELALLEALRKVRGAGLRCSLVLVPRHAERRLEIEKLLRSAGLRYHFRTRGRAQGEVDVAVGDTTGEQRRLVQLADLVFVGKSLPPRTEGQTPIEAAILGRAMIFGPGMTNFVQVATELADCGGARVVADERELADACLELLKDDTRRGEMASAAMAWNRANNGATARTLAILRTYTKSGSDSSSGMG